MAFAQTYDHRIGGHTVDGERPRYNSDGTFNGHTVLAVTGAGRLIEPTIGQFAEIPGTRRAALPLQGHHQLGKIGNAAPV